MARILLIRYSIAVMLAVAFFRLLPLELEYRQALAFLVFEPISSAVPAFTAELGEDFGLSQCTQFDFGADQYLLHYYGTGAGYVRIACKRKRKRVK